MVSQFTHTNLKQREKIKCNISLFHIFFNFGFKEFFMVDTKQRG